MFDPLAIQARQAERRRLREATTEGPWRAANGREKDGYREGVVNDERVILQTNPNFDGQADKAFIAHAHNDDPAADVDACLAEIVRLNAELETRCGDIIKASHAYVEQRKETVRLRAALGDAEVGDKLWQDHQCP